jgi:hypothetical protein
MNGNRRRSGALLLAPAGVVVVTAVSVLILWALLSRGMTAIITPAPESIAEQFGVALGARRYEGALNQLTGALKRSVKQEELKALVDQIERQHQGVEDIQAQAAQAQGDSATVDLQVKYEDGSQKTVQVALERENHLWKVSSLDAARQMGQ